MGIEAPVVQPFLVFTCRKNTIAENGLVYSDRTQDSLIFVAFARSHWKCLFNIKIRACGVTRNPEDFSFSEWAKRRIDHRNLSIWRSAVRGVRLPAEIYDTLLWIDSTDFPLAKFKGYSKKSLDHSFKLNRPGRRFMMVLDGKGDVKYLNDGFMPKTHDRTFLELHCDSLLNLFSGAVFIGDNHFSRGKTLFHPSEVSPLRAVLTPRTPCAESSMLQFSTVVFL
eukprot:scaffold3396_cov268-Ochromonas_danica.AAC.3